MLCKKDRLAHVFYRLRLIEAFGTGIPKIMECYRGQKAQPVIEISDNAFKITLPNTNFLLDWKRSPVRKRTLALLGAFTFPPKFE